MRINFSDDSASATKHLAHHHRVGRGPTIVFLPGYMSDMEGTKALALDAWAKAEGRAMLRFDYTGCGTSPGAFEEQTLAQWRDDVLTMIDDVVRGPVVLVGSSMGGWLMLLVALARPEQVIGLVGIAAAPDFTGWGFSEEQKLTILRDGRLLEETSYSDQPYVTSRAFWESGESLRIMHAPLMIDCPIRLLHGQEDPDVPWTWAPEIARLARSADVQVTLIKDGDHRLSRPGDIALLIATVKTLMEQL